MLWLIFEIISRFMLMKADSPDELHSFWQHISEGGAVHYGVFPFTVLNDIIRQVEEVKPVWCIRWEKNKKKV